LTDLATAIAAKTTSDLRWSQLPLSGEVIFSAPNGTYAVLSGSRWGNINPDELSHVATHLARSLDRMARRGYDC